MTRVQVPYDACLFLAVRRVLQRFRNRTQQAAVCLLPADSSSHKGSRGSSSPCQSSCLTGRSLSFRSRFYASTGTSFRFRRATGCFLRYASRAHSRFDRR